MEYRDLRTDREHRQVVELEKKVWGCTEGDEVVPACLLAVTVKRGAILIGAFTPAGDMVGYVYSLPGLKNGRLMQWSHTLAVLEAHRRSGAGHQLKLGQRQRTLDLGLDLVEWTFDPLQAVNAHFNLRRLGVIIEEYVENAYGESANLLMRGTPTDRFLAQWWIRSSQVEARLRTGLAAEALDLPMAAPVNQAGVTGEWLECLAVDLSATEPRLLVEIPLNFGAMQLRRPEIAREWRLRTRELFVSYFSRKYRVVDFILDREAGRGHYVLERSGPPGLDADDRRVRV